MKALIAKIITSSNPKKTYSKLSKKDKALLKKELKGGKTTLRLVGSVSTNAIPDSSSDSTCWRKTLVAEYHGGIATLILFTTTNTTEVCVSGGSVSQVDIPDQYQTTWYLGWQKDGLSAASLNVDWEGRGVVRGDFAWGAAGWYLLKKEICAQVRLNADLVHYATSSSCTVGA